MKSVADRLIWRPPLMRPSARPITEKIVNFRFRNLPPEAKPGDWLLNESPRARRAYRILEIGEVGPSGYHKLLLESHPVSAVPAEARTITFYSDKR